MPNLLALMLGLTTVEFWTIVGGVVAVVAFLGGIVIWAIRWVGAIWRRPVVLIHWWWETVISHDKRLLSAFLVVGTLRPVGEGQSRKYAYHEIERRMASRPRNESGLSDLAIDSVFGMPRPMGSRSFGSSFTTNHATRS